MHESGVAMLFFLSPSSQNVSFHMRWVNSKRRICLFLVPAGVIEEVPKVLKEVAIEHHLHAAAAE
jgi:hypothetical protein